MVISDKKMIFVSYYSGAGGRFLTELCSILLNKPNKDAWISTDGEVMIRSNMLEIIIANNLKYRHLTNRLIIDDDELLRELLTTWNNDGPTDMDIVPSHILAIQDLLEYFPNSKFIVVVPRTDDEFNFSKSNWITKNTSNKFNPRDVDYAENAKTWQFNSSYYIYPDEVINNPRCLRLEIPDIFSNDANQMISKILDFINPPAKVQNGAARMARQALVEDGIKFHKEYMKFNKTM